MGYAVGGCGGQSSPRNRVFARNGPPNSARAVFPSGRLQLGWGWGADQTHSKQTLPLLVGNADEEEITALRWQGPRLFVVGALVVALVNTLLLPLLWSRRRPVYRVIRRHPIYRVINQSINQLIDQSINQSINHLIHQSMDQSINHSVH